MGLIRAIFRRMAYSVVTLDRLIPNLVFVLAVTIIAFLVLYRLSRVDKGYIKLTLCTFSSLFILTLLGVVFSSPLPVGDSDRGVVLIRYMSLFFVVLTLFVCSYMDKQTGTMIVGYVLLGFLAQLILLITGLVSRRVSIGSLEAGMLFACMAILFVCFLLGAESGLDLVLFYMCMMHIVIMAEGWFVPLCVVCFMTSFVIATIINGLFKVPKMLRRKDRDKKEKLRFPFTTYIYIGLLVSLFFM